MSLCGIHIATGGPQIETPWYYGTNSITHLAPGSTCTMHDALSVTPLYDARSADCGYEFHHAADCCTLSTSYRRGRLIAMVNADTVPVTGVQIAATPLTGRGFRRCSITRVSTAQDQRFSATHLSAQVDPLAARKLPGEARPSLNRLAQSRERCAMTRHTPNMHADGAGSTCPATTHPTNAAKRSIRVHAQYANLSAVGANCRNTQFYHLSYMRH